LKVYLLLLLFAFPFAAFAQNGAALYQQHCAMCHDAPKGRIPPVGALKTMSAASILNSLETGAMRNQGQALSMQERTAVAEYLAGGPAKPASASVPINSCKATAPSAEVSGKSDWNGFGAGLSNARFQGSDAAGLRLADIPKLKLKWAFGLGDITNARGQPVVSGGRLFASAASKLYALDAKSGCVYWTFDAEGPIRSGVVAGKSTIFFGDAKANLYAVDVATGKLAWKTHPEDNAAAMITDAPSLYEGVLYLGVSSLEELFSQKPEYECCTFRGSVVAVDAASGKVLWKTYTIAQEAKPTTKTATGVQRRGPSGAAVWSTPTVDVKRNAIYVATGDNYSDPTTETSDAVLALDRATGKLLWSRQMTANDAYNMSCFGGGQNCPESKGPDFDFGQPPILVALPNGSQELVIGQKSGVAWGVDPDQQGKVLWQTRVGKGGSLGGSQWGSAADDHTMYVAISDVGFREAKDGSGHGTGKYEVDPEKGGGLFALDLVSGKTVWSAPPKSCGERKNCSPAQSAAVAAMPGVVFEGSMDGHLRAHASSSGDVIWDFDTAREYETVNGLKARGGSMDGGGAAIAAGMVYSYSGYGQWGGMPGNVLLAFSVDGK
jgi:polyvinyl alcohol dehydrogenase (cytochrome)